ncbi:hypothetical protein AgCh_037674 [Apium graveolens]
MARQGAKAQNKEQNPAEIASPGKPDSYPAYPSILPSYHQAYRRQSQERTGGRGVALENGNVSVFRLGLSKSKLSLSAVTIKKSLKRRKRIKERFRLKLREVNKEKKAFSEKASVHVKARKMLFAAIPSICASSSKKISIYNEEMIVARCFIGFIIFSRKSLGKTFKVTLDGRIQAIQEKSQQFPNPNEVVPPESNEQQ